MFDLSSLRQTDTNIKGDEDRQTGPMFPVLESGLYSATIELAYLEESKKGAKGLTVHFKTDDGVNYRETFWMTSSTQKGGLPYYVRDGQKIFLKGYNMANALCLLTVQKEIHEMSGQEKMVERYNSELKKRMAMPTYVLNDLLGQKIILGLHKQLRDKTVLQNGKYVPTGEFRDANEIDKLFQYDYQVTLQEAREGIQQPTYIHQWEKDNKGVTKDRTDKSSGAQQGLPPMGGTSPSEPAPQALGDQPAGVAAPKLFPPKQ